MYYTPVHQCFFSSVFQTGSETSFINVYVTPQGNAQNLTNCILYIVLSLLEKCYVPVSLPSFKALIGPRSNTYVQPYIQCCILSSGFFDRYAALTGGELLVPGFTLPVLKSRVKKFVFTNTMNELLMRLNYMLCWF